MDKALLCRVEAAMAIAGTLHIERAGLIGDARTRCTSLRCRCAELRWYMSAARLTASHVRKCRHAATTESKFLEESRTRVVLQHQI